MRIQSILSFAVACFLLPAMAQAADSTIKIENFIGTVVISPSSSGDITIEAQRKNEGVSLTSNASGLVIDGGVEDFDYNECRNIYGSKGKRWVKQVTGDERFGGAVNLGDYPRIEVSTPAGTNLIIRKSIPFVEAGNLSDATISLSSCGEIYVGNVSGLADLKIGGSGDFTGKDIAEAKISIGGSGDVELASVKQLAVKIGGSGDVDIETASTSDISVSGSGDVSIQKVKGDVAIRSSGSGDVELGRLIGDVMYQGSGSSDFVADYVEGRTSIENSGNGDVEINDGTVTELYVSATGSSNVTFDGTAQSAELYAKGSSDIYVEKVVGNLIQRKSRSADIYVND